jgi:TDG/mug DNA glycosylase family protein
MSAKHVLPDVLVHDLGIVFCGTAAGSASARRGAYYAGPGNAFWRTLHRVGLTPYVLEPEDYRRLTSWNMGLTDLAKRVAGSDTILVRRDFDVERLRSVIAEYRPQIVAFTSKRAAEEFVGHPVDYGMMSDAVGTTGLFALPSPSGAARRYWNEDHWRSLGSLVRLPGATGRGLPAASSIASPQMRP